MKNLLKNSYLIFILILITCISYSKDELLFTINNNPTTTIDLNQRIYYLNLFNDFEINSIEKDTFINDLISIKIFNEFAIKRNVSVQKDKIDEIFNSLIKHNLYKVDKFIENKVLTKKIIIENIRLDLLRDKIIDLFLVEKIKNINLLNDDNNATNIFNIKINYFIVDKKHKNIIEKIINKEKRLLIENIKNILDKNKIKYEFYNKEVSNLSRINLRLKKIILENNSSFYLDEDQYILFGTIEKTIRKDIDLKYSFFHIEPKEKKYFENMIKDEINCKNINEKKMNKNLNIKEYQGIDIKKLNVNIFQNLYEKNEKVIINNNNTKLLILLCEINYNKKLAKDKLYQNKLRQLAAEIESEFLQIKKQEYKFQIFN